MQVVITADDYGLAAGVNASIESLASEGLLTATSIMVHEAAQLGSVGRLRDTGIALGPHLVFVEERPLLPANIMAPLLERDGRFPRSYASLFLKLLARPGAVHLLRQEAEAQIDRYLSLGLAVNVINSHQHVHLFPPVWRALTPVFQRFPSAAIRAATHGRMHLSKQGMLDIVSRVATLQAPLAGHRMLHPLGVSHSGHLTTEVATELAAVWKRRQHAKTAMNATAEIVTHPALEDAELRRRYGHWGFAWYTEHQMLALGSLHRSLAEHSIEVWRCQ